MDKYNQDITAIVLKDEPLRSESTQSTTGEELRTNSSNSRFYDVTGSKPKGHPTTDVSGVKGVVQCCKMSHTIGTWNVRTMNQGKLDVVKGEMSRMNIDILGISELKWTGMGHFKSDDFHIFYCGQENHRRNGVAIIVNKKLSNSVLGYNPKSDRMISIRLLGKPINITVIQVYAPTTDAEDSEIDDFYSNLQQFVEETPKKDAIFIIGDWNAKVGSTAEKGITGNSGLGERNEAGDRLIEFCQNHSLCITNTYFIQPKRRLYTWTSPDGQYRNQIDYILCSQRWKSSVQIAKTRPGADCGSDHELLIAKFRLKLKTTNKVVRPVKYNLSNIPYEYTVKVQNRFDGLNLFDRVPDELWTEIRDIIKDEAKKNIPKNKTQKKAKWLTVSTLKIADERRNAKVKGDKENFSRLNAMFQREARNDKEIYMNLKCQKVEENNQKGNIRDFFKKINEIKTKFRTKIGTIKDNQGKDLTEMNDILNRWREYTEELYQKNIESEDAIIDLGMDLEPDILESEVEWALKSIAKNKAVGVDEIAIELILPLGDSAVKLLHSLCQQIWKRQAWPKDWTRSIFIPIPKKGSAKECENYRTIALISHTSKIMLKILQGRLEQYITRELPEVQAGFRRGRGTRDHIANIRWIMEKAREYQKDIFLCFIDYSKAFDCVDHNKLWSVLQNMGVPKHLICLLKNLYTDQQASVRTDYGLTDWFDIKKGVRQGCILSPCLFNLYAEFIMRKAEIDESDVGVKVAGRNINNLRYADDTTLLTESEEDLVSLLIRVKEESEKAGLLLNMKKTKIMSTRDINNIQVDGKEIGVVENFIFLGSKIQRDGDCSHEIRRRLLLGRKAMISLDKVLKSRDISKQTKIRIVKAMVFPVVTYGSESWTIKKADRRKIDAFELWCWRKILRTPWTAKKTNKSILSEINPDCSLEASMLRLKLKYFGHIMRKEDSLEKSVMLGKVEGSRKRGRQKTKWIDIIFEVMEKKLQQLKEMVEDRKNWRTKVYQVTKSRNRLND
ncbi:uncharacterized protein DEA37_0012425 [Paragonimus westermani]|uniref:Reverse transcriptase domain-containing protein n=1 Tax=Paragonimus westermani TaxID=34504 RepID=A0A5J4N3B2_9TREM|nr:uncharacterized protein DEA37_0012425 [Paragonimus westermani]